MDCARGPRSARARRRRSDFWRQGSSSLSCDHESPVYLNPQPLINHTPLGRLWKRLPRLRQHSSVSGAPPPPLLLPFLSKPSRASCGLSRRSSGVLLRGRRRRRVRPRPPRPSWTSCRLSSSQPRLVAMSRLCGLCSRPARAHLAEARWARRRCTAQPTRATRLSPSSYSPPVRATVTYTRRPIFRSRHPPL